MANSDTNKDSTGNEVDNIRKILFGDQVNQIDEQIKRIDAAISQLQAENRNLRQALEMEVDAREKDIHAQKQALDLESTAREKAFKSLKESLESAIAGLNEIWSQNYTNQTGLVDGLQNALDIFKQELKSPTKPGK